MKAIVFFRSLFIPALLMGFFPAGCFGPVRPVDFYTLAPLPRSTQGADASPKIIIALLPVVIPEYMDRPQIVIRTADNQIAISEFNRWGGSLKNELTRVLVENLNILLSDRGATVMMDTLAFAPKYLITVNVNRFDGSLGDAVWLNAVWSVRDSMEKKVLAVKISAIQEVSEAHGFDALVAAESRAIAALSREIAVAVLAVLQPYDRPHHVR